AYRCYCTKEELEAMREEQRTRGEKPRYDGRWRDSREKPPVGVPPVIRFKNPLDGEVAFNDLVKGEISVANNELDDLVIMRADGTPTYNFGVVVDDFDMNITHVIRGDDHVNNTPRQINILQALRAPLPEYAHVPMILGHDGERLSKRHGAVSVLQYRDDGYLPEALINYLARLGWAHGDDEIFSREQFVSWFELDAINKAPARFDPEKLSWVNQQYIKRLDNIGYGKAVLPKIQASGTGYQIGLEVAALFKDRVPPSKLVEATKYFYLRPTPSPELQAKYYSSLIKPALEQLQERFKTIAWDRKALHDTLKLTAQEFKLKLGQLAMPLRVMVTGVSETPSIDAVLELIGREEVLRRIATELTKFAAV
ncbi:MAG: glutamate--tRNA ligase, partial [Gammaproteobacteria bacterium]